MDEYSENPTENSTAGGSGGDVVIASDELQEYTNSDQARFGRTLMSTPLVIPSNGGRYIGGILSGTLSRVNLMWYCSPACAKGHSPPHGGGKCRQRAAATGTGICAHAFERENSVHSL